jgi:hypothetical protein
MCSFFRRHTGHTPTEFRCMYREGALWLVSLYIPTVNRVHPSTDATLSVPRCRRSFL